MKLFLQILLIFLTWFSNLVNATPAFSKVALPIYTISFPKADNQNQESEVKIGVSNFARSGILENSFSQKAILWESSVLENRAREGNVNVVSGAGNIIPKSVDEIKALLKTDNGTSVFWSGRTNGIGGEIKALEIAKSRGGTTLEGLLKEKNIELPPWNPSDPNVTKLWEDVSEEYAKQVSGEVRAVIGSELRPGNIWQAKELDALKSNINVTKITTIDPVTLIESIIFTR